MRLIALGSFVLALMIAFCGQTATAQEKAVAKWEYAELSFRTLPGRPAGKDAEGKDVPAKESTTTIRWTTGADDLTLNGWGEMAEKMKVEFKKDASPVSQRLQVMNALGSAGWELVEQQAPTPAPAATAGGRGNQQGFNDRTNFGGAPVSRIATGTMLFKRRTQ